MSWACRATGKTDGETLKAKGIKGILGIDAEGDKFVVETLYGEKTVAKADAAARPLPQLQEQKARGL